jgi:hypothetical protein
MHPLAMNGLFTISTVPLRDKGEQMSVSRRRHDGEALGDRRTQQLGRDKDSDRLLPIAVEL